MSPQDQQKIKTYWQQYLSQQDADAREALLKHYLYLVKYAVGRMLIKLPAHIDGDDLIGYGLIGLIQSLEKFDPQRDVKFETFAMTRIRGAILDALRAQDWMPRSLRKKAKEIEAAIQIIEAQKGQTASEEEIAQALAISVDELQSRLAETSFLVVSLDYLLSPQDEGLSLKDTIADEKLQREEEAANLREALAQAIQSLPEREAHLISFYYYEGLTMKEIGQVLKLTEARVCQLHSQAIHRLRARMKNF